MKSFKLIAFASLLTVSAFIITTYTACKDACKDVACLNGGACQSGKCICPTGFLGENCEKTLCTGVVCQNNGACIEGVCQCMAGYEGKFCETLVAEKLLGVWNGQSTCGSTTKHYALTIEKGFTKSDIRISGIHDRSQPVQGAINELKEVIISKQSLGYGEFVEGALKYENNKLFFNFTFYFNGATESCTGEYSK